MELLVKAVLAQHRLSPRSNKGLFARYASILMGFQDQRRSGQNQTALTRANSPRTDGYTS